MIVLALTGEAMLRGDAPREQDRRSCFVPPCASSNRKARRPLDANRCQHSVGEHQ